MMYRTSQSGTRNVCLIRQLVSPQGLRKQYLKRRVPTTSANVIILEGRKVTFEVTARDEVEIIAKGTHTRYIVAAQSFQIRADAKLTGEDH